MLKHLYHTLLSRTIHTKKSIATMTAISSQEQIKFMLSCFRNANPGKVLWRHHRSSIRNTPNSSRLTGRSWQKSAASSPSAQRKIQTCPLHQISLPLTLTSAHAVRSAGSASTRPMPRSLLAVMVLATVGIQALLRHRKAKAKAEAEAKAKGRGKTEAKQKAKAQAQAQVLQAKMPKSVRFKLPSKTKTTTMRK